LLRYPPETDEQKKNLYAWFATRTPPISVEKTPKIIEDVEALYGKKTWGAVGVFHLFSSPHSTPHLFALIILYPAF